MHDPFDTTPRYEFTDPYARQRKENAKRPVIAQSGREQRRERRKKERKILTK